MWNVFGACVVSWVCFTGLGFWCVVGRVALHWFAMVVGLGYAKTFCRGLKRNATVGLVNVLAAVYLVCDLLRTVLLSCGDGVFTEACRVVKGAC